MTVSLSKMSSSDDPSGMTSRSSYLSEEGELLNLTWNDTSPRWEVERPTPWEWDDATWILAASFIIFTMQTG